MPHIICISNRIFSLIVFIDIVLGIGVGYILSEHPQILVFKVLNVIGLLYGLLGIVVLSEVLATRSEFKKLSVELIAPGILWLHTLVPLGAIIGALIAFGSPSRWVIFKFALSFFFYSIIPLSLLEGTVVFPRFKMFISLESRWRYFGLFLLLSSMLLQLIASIMDLQS